MTLETRSIFREIANPNVTLLGNTNSEIMTPGRNQCQSTMDGIKFHLTSKDSRTLQNFKQDHHATATE